LKELGAGNLKLFNFVALKKNEKGNYLYTLIKNI